MGKKSVFVPFANLSFTAGKINSSGLIQADGVIHSGAGFVAPPPFFLPADDFEDIADTVTDPVFGHVNLTTRSDASHFTIFLYADGELYRVAGDPDTAGWAVSACGSVSVPLAGGAGSFASFGPHEVFAAGHDNPVLICLDGEANFEACFTSPDKPQFNHVSVIGRRLLFANAANTGSAGNPDPNTILAWWGATDNARVVGDAVSHPQSNTGRNPLVDQYGDITGLSSGRFDATLFKAKSIWRMELGGSYGFRFDPLTKGIGVAESRSIVELNDDDYCMSTIGPARVRGTSVEPLGDGYFTLRGILQDSPAEPGFRVISSAADRDNAIIYWLLAFQEFPYTYDDSSGVPVETAGTPATCYALLAYNAVSNQFSFVWRHRSDDGVLMRQESAPGTARRFRPLCLIDQVPWKNNLQMGGVAMLCLESATTDPVGPRYPKLFLSGLSGNSFTPDWTVNQNSVLRTGLIPLGGRKVVVKGVRPILRSRRANNLPGVSLRVLTTMTPTGTERTTRTYTLAVDGDRNGIVKTPDAPVCALFAIEMSIDSRTADPLAYSYLLHEIEGVEVFLEDAGESW